MAVIAKAPGRVNLIGDHTDYTGGLCFPMAIDHAIEIAGRPTDRAEIRLSTSGEHDAVVPLEGVDPEAAEPEWARYVAGVVAEVRPISGFIGTVTTTLPAGAGLSSSAALEVACALALGADRSNPVELARLCQRAEHAARGVPTGLLDQLAVIGGVAGHGLLLDCTDLTLSPVTLPPASEAEWIVIHSSTRSLADSGYSQPRRRAGDGRVGDRSAAPRDTRLGRPDRRSGRSGPGAPRREREPAGARLRDRRRER